jgi:aconitate hydratase
LKRGQKLTVRAEAGGKVIEFETLARMDTPDDVEFIKHGGILPLTLRELLQASST